MVYINTTGKHNEVWLDKPYATITVECPDCPSTEDAYESGYTDGSEDGFQSGYTSGRTDGYDDGWGPGYQSGYTDGVASVDCQDFYNSGVTDGFGSGYTSGVTDQKAKLVTTAITSNGTYERADGYRSVYVNVPQTGHTDQEMQDSWDSGYTSGYTAGQEDCSGSSCNLQERKVVNFSELTWSYKPKAPWVTPQYTISGGPLYVSADSGYDGLIEVVVGGKLFVREAYDDGYGNGYQSGYTAGQKTCSGGSCEGIWEDGYDSGFTDGAASVDCQEFYNSGVTDGYQSGYTSGKTDGGNQQKAKLASTAFTTNGTYTRVDGWSSVTVNVAQTGYTQQDLDNAYQRGYEAGADACSSLLPTAITLNVSNTITDTGTATTTYSPSTAYTDIYYTSSDNTKATIDQNTGVITVVSDGSVTICAKDRMSGLQDCKTINVVKSKGYFTATYMITSTTQPTEILNNCTDCGRSGLTDYIRGASLVNGTNVPVATGFTFPSTGLQTVRYTLPANTLGPELFDQVDTVVSVNIVSGITDIGFRCFNSATSLSSITIANGVETIDYQAFSWTDLRNVVLPNSVRYLGLEKITGQDNDGYVFAFCHNLTSVTLSTSLSGLDSYTFIGCENLTGLSIHNHITTLGRGTFSGCTSLTSMTLPGSITSIGRNCFENCTGLTEMYVSPATPPTINQSNSFGYGSTYPLYVPTASLNAYRTAWPDLASRVQVKS